MKLKLLFLFILLSLSLNAQLEFSLVEDTQEATLDLSDMWVKTQLNGHLVNNTSDSVEIKFEIIDVNAPSDWQFQLSVTLDGGFGFSWNVPTNIDSTLGLILPIPIIAGDSSAMNLSIQPRGVAGCGTYEIRISLASEPSNIVATGIYNYKINSPDCTTSSRELERDQIQISPNPTKDSFTIKENQSIHEVQIFNLVGKEMLRTSYQSGKVFKIIPFPNGCYLVRTLDKNGITINTSRLIKN